jgi:two-component system, NtrC family, nitrogen regulation sensor histidine kinase NtrY
VSFRTRLLLIFTLAVVAAVTAVGLIVAGTTRRAFERQDSQRVEALAAQFHNEFTRRRQEIAQRVERIANAESTLNLAIAVGGPEPDYSPYVNEAPALAAAHGLDLLELVAGDGTIVSSAQWPARFGYREEWLTGAADWNAQGAFLKREELPGGTALALVAVRVVKAGDRQLLVAGGETLDQEFLNSLTLPAGMRVLLYRNLGPHFSPHLLTGTEGEPSGAARLAPLVERVLHRHREVSATVAGDAGPETFHAFPLTGGEHAVLGVLLVGSSRSELARLENFLLWTAVFTGIGGILLGVALAWWATARVTRPVEELASGARAVAAGDLKVRVPVRSRDEIGRLSYAFNSMTRQLSDQRDRLLQAERVAAWRELARRLAHELKNPLFPLQITIENMQRARGLSSAQFDEVFEESTGTLLAELANLKRIIARFSDFAKMPRPELQPADLNGVVAAVMKLFEAQLAAASVTANLELAPLVEYREHFPALADMRADLFPGSPDGGNT